jgi:uncharacterized protein YbjT (DUF2867 family)
MSGRQRTWRRRRVGPGLGISCTFPASELTLHRLLRTFAVALAVQAGFPDATIVRPTVMFGLDDAFLNTMLMLLKRLPTFPIFGSGNTRLQPVSVEDVAEAIVRALGREATVYELGGPPDLRLPTPHRNDRATGWLEAGCVSRAVHSLAHGGAYRGAVADPTAHAKSGGSHED